jgi:hypothetical protein
MPKKQFLKDNKKKSKHAAPVSILALSFLLPRLITDISQALETADDYLAGRAHRE